MGFLQLFDFEIVFLISFLILKKSVNEFLIFNEDEYHKLNNIFTNYQSYKMME